MYLFVLVSVIVPGSVKLSYLEFNAKVKQGAEGL